MPAFLAIIEVHLKPGALDPQGQAVEHGLHALGFAGVAGVRVGKHLRLRLDAADAAAAHQTVRRMCEELLANPVMETYSFEVTAAS